MTVLAVATGGVAGIGMGYVLQRGQLCFHSMIDGAQRGSFLLLRAWGLGVAIAAVGLSVLLATPLGAGLDHGLPFAPVGNIAGGLLIGLGMVIARSCVSGLFFKLGAGMLGATIGLAGWAVGELVARRIAVPGPVLLPPGDGATIPELLGLPRAVVAVAFLVAVGAFLWRRRSVERPEQSWQWGWPMLGVALGVVTVAGWVLAALGGSPFGPSSVGAVTSIAVGAPNWWLLSFLVGIVAGALVAARSAGGFRLRGEQPVRYAQLAVGGALLGAGGWIAGGCNLGHGLSGVAQLNVSSWVVVVAIAGGVGIGRLIRTRVSAS
ncbi:MULTISPECIES: YeeE/YedE thiosulfate transporter family protein [unclassified Pseudonocardia]|jgi:hypothetical protein|uniref:YeeE/YedE thiosulfate transporter family protein n=1 Tax=unclassified Pseudonocardia TaxID=2619320 RepID=UPI00095A7AF6|nr:MULTISPECIES: YeeE/YedE thiosulfate transporter family protein [unclassified Pseudonocardia]MBN9096644.1 YeeE/YedE family protein [Pseudonocardia sp.]OJY53354.1 MAG: hypothetical protein BGP03_03935 [Pseudonocardia sp. 73-21]